MRTDPGETATSPDWLETLVPPNGVWVKGNLKNFGKKKMEKVMQNQKRNLWLVALVGALALATGCNDEGGTTSPSNNPSNPGSVAPGSVDVKAHKWVKIGTPGANFAPAGKNVATMGVSEDGKFLYVAGAAANELSAADLKDTTKLGENASWKKFDLGATGIVAGGAGGDLANMNAGTKIVRIVGTKTGAAISGARAGNGTAALLTGNTFTAAWTHGNTHLVGNTPADVLWAGALKKANGDEYFYVNNPAAFAENSTINQVTSAVGIKARLNVKYDRNGNFTNAAAPHHFVNLGNKAFIVDKTGFTLMSDAIIGTTTDGVAPAAAGDVAATWKIAAADNDLINNVVAAGDLGFVALKPAAAGAGANTGGVAVFDSSKPAAVKGKPDATWSAKDVLTVVMIDKKPYAVEADGLYLVDLATAGVSKRGAKFAVNADLPAKAAAVTAGTVYDVDGGNLPKANITFAVVDKNGNLFISTDNDHIVMRAAAKDVTVNP